MITQTGQENGKLERQTGTANWNGKPNNGPSGNRTITKMNPFTIPLQCLQRNAPPGRGQRILTECVRNASPALFARICGPSR
jgi:hypothetical protein